MNNKTNKELAEYLSFINPNKRDIYMAIAEFMGENEIIKRTKKRKRRDLTNGK